MKAFEKKVWPATPTMHGDGRGQTNAYITGECLDVGMDLLTAACACPATIR